MIKKTNVLIFYYVTENYIGLYTITILAPHIINMKYVQNSIFEILILHKKFFSGTNTVKLISTVFPIV